MLAIVSDKATKLRSSLDFETPREASTSLPGIWRFDMTSSTGKGKFLTWPQEKTETSLMLHSRRSLSHLSRVNEPVFRMSVSWFRVSTYFTWIGSRLIRWNNQSGATLWVRDTCLAVGILQEPIFGARRHKIDLSLNCPLRRETFSFRSTCSWFLTRFTRQVSR